MEFDGQERNTFAIEAYGVAVAIELIGSGLLASVRRILPPTYGTADPADARVIFRLKGESDGRFSLTQNGRCLIEGATVEMAVGTLDGFMRQAIAARASEMVFVHAGVVAHRGAALLLPGSSFAGKTELVVALLQAGATYYSDEFALLDRDGLVHPYPRPVSVRDRRTTASQTVAAQKLGARIGSSPIAPAVIAFTHYVPGAVWEPAVLSGAAVALKLLAHAGQARRDPERTLHAVCMAANRAIALQGPRGEAAPTAAALLARLRAAATP
jgi:hypothetical protein